jgi:hypothetical protein
LTRIRRIPSFMTGPNSMTVFLRVAAGVDASAHCFSNLF